MKKTFSKLMRWLNHFLKLILEENYTSSTFFGRERDEIMGQEHVYTFINKKKNPEASTLSTTVYKIQSRKNINI